MVFSDERRELLAKTIMDLAKVQAGAAFATLFFKELPVWGRWLMAAMFVGLIVVGFLVQPSKKRENKKEA